MLAESLKLKVITRDILYYEIHKKNQYKYAYNESNLHAFFVI